MSLTLGASVALRRVERAGWWAGVIGASVGLHGVARRLGQEGAVVVSFTVGRDGQVLDALLKQQSGSDTLDAAALALFRGARAPAFPADMAQPQMTVSVPVRYRLKD